MLEMIHKVQIEKMLMPVLLVLLLEYGDMKQVLAFSVLGLLFFGAQRMQADLSFWQMWIYAMFVWILMKSYKVNCQV